MVIRRYLKSFEGVIRDVRILDSNDLELKYTEFKKDNDKLYSMAINSVVTGTVQESVKKLKVMLAARENMNQGKISKLNTDMLIGNMLGKEYIYPKTQNPSNEDYIRAINTIKKKDAEGEDVVECE